MINICLCDDDNFFLEECSKILYELADKNKILLRIENFNSGEELLFFIEEDINKFDIIIMDMLMKKINGIETIKTLRDYGYNGLVIFLTDSKEHAIESYEVEPLTYLLKEKLYSEVFEKNFLKAIGKVEKEKSKRIVISVRQKNIVINLNEIVYIESMRKKLIIHKKDSCEEVYYTLEGVLEKIKEYGFIRCHKSYIVNSRFILSYNKVECQLVNGGVLPIGRKYSDTFSNEYLRCEFERLVL